ncbi:hypothetical protein Taro_042025 [Colocasia esculenta]|uniref:Uncharacterized protein n=1 Tax=Colocasia esculenta TaxID=4460 RepID=A0A843WFU4_COLES|nr:hypothetical protein [Colocasia esculenta]
MSSDRRPRSTVANADPSPADVEELLRAAQDDLLLKLSVDVHTTSSSSSLDPDLSHRFDVLRSHRAPPPPKREPPSDGPSNLPGGGGGGATAASTSAAVEGTRGGRSEGEEDEANKILGDDLAARFAALKGSSSSYLPAGSVARKPERIPKEVDDDGGGEDDDSDESDDGDGGVSKKEVEKLMQWAMDAARLDPDPSNSDDEEGIGKREEKASDQDDDDEEEDDALAKAEEKKKRQAEGKKPPGRKWFLF